MVKHQPGRNREHAPGHDCRSVGGNNLFQGRCDQWCLRPGQFKRNHHYGDTCGWRHIVSGFTSYLYQHFEFDGCRLYRNNCTLGMGYYFRIRFAEHHSCKCIGNFDYGSNRYVHRDAILSCGNHQRFVYGLFEHCRHYV